MGNLLDRFTIVTSDDFAKCHENLNRCSKLALTITKLSFLKKKIRILFDYWERQIVLISDSLILFTQQYSDPASLIINCRLSHETTTRTPPR